MWRVVATVTAFAIAMAHVETMIVVYLRRLYYPWRLSLPAGDHRHPDPGAGTAARSRDPGHAGCLRHRRRPHPRREAGQFPHRLRGLGHLLLRVAQGRARLAGVAAHLGRPVSHPGAMGRARYRAGQRRLHHDRHGAGASAPGTDGAPRRRRHGASGRHRRRPASSSSPPSRSTCCRGWRTTAPCSPAGCRRPTAGGCWPWDRRWPSPHSPTGRRAPSASRNPRRQRARPVPAHGPAHGFTARPRAAIRTPPPQPAAARPARPPARPATPRAPASGCRSGAAAAPCASPPPR